MTQPTKAVCDMCGEFRALHLAGEYLICDPCDESFWYPIDETSIASLAGTKPLALGAEEEE